VYTPVGKKEQGAYALECGVRALTFFSRYFSLAYPLKKYDMVAIPDFSAGAMENWGLVTYRFASQSFPHPHLL
jgi:aminopeptidase N